MKRMLIQTQLSNYTKDGLFILECDSGWQMVMGRARELLKQIPDLVIDVMCPARNQIVTQPENINPDVKVGYIPGYIPPNALLSRHHFDTRETRFRCKYDIAYINDPMQFRNLRLILDGCCDKFVVHNHFVDNPSCPKFPEHLSLWHGQCEAVQRADLNFWQCKSALAAFMADGGQACNSFVWDDGYSVVEITKPVDLRNVRFDPKILKQKPIVFVPNRVGGRGVSSDYTNCGKFLFELMHKFRNYDVVAGNPSQKFSNRQLVEECGILPLTIDALTRDEYKLVAGNSAVVVALYNNDTYGGTAVRECIELGALPLWLDCNEYAVIAKEARYPFLCKTDFSDVGVVLNDLLSLSAAERLSYLQLLRCVVQTRCSYEYTTHKAAERMGLL